MKIVIVDDESLARDMLKNQLKQLHYEAVYLAETGEKALEIMQSERPDLVFLDICMPEMSGIELMERAALLGNDWIYVITSSYDLFEYAQRVMELGAFKYLLKPIDDSKLEQALQAAERKLNQRKLADNRLFQLNQDAVRSQDLLQRKYLYELLNSLDSGHLCQIAFSKPVFLVCLYSIHRKDQADQGQHDDKAAIADNQDDIGLLRFGVENIIKEILMQYEIEAYFFEEGTCYGVLCNYQPMEEIHRGSPMQICFPGWRMVYQTIFRECQAFMNELNPCDITFGIGKETEGSQRLSEAYRSAQEALHQKLIKGNGAVYYAGEAAYMELAKEWEFPGEESKDRDSKDRDSKDREFKDRESKGRDSKSGDLPGNRIEAAVNSMYAAEEGAIEHAVEALYHSYIHAGQVDIKKLNKMHLNLFVMLHKELEQKGIDSFGVLEDEFLLYHKIQTLDSLQAMKEFLMQIMGRCGEEIRSKSGSGNERIMQCAKAFIRDHIGDNLTLESVAESVQLSPVYFSKLFKNEVGMTFIEYATRARIEEAKKLLRQNMKAADICDKIGFLDVKHFYKVFKKYEGITPGDYKKRG